MKLRPTKPPFPRTICACGECVGACKDRPGSLGPGDLERLATRLVSDGRSTDLIAAFKFFRASKGPVVTVNDGLRRIAVISPRLKIDTAEVRSGGCVFLDEHDRCTVHDIAPFGCAYFDAHMTPSDRQRRSEWLYRRVLEDGVYQQERSVLVSSYGEIEPFPGMAEGIRSVPHVEPLA